MDITLIPKAESNYDKKLHKSFISDEGMVHLTDCSLVLLHKVGLRPIYLMENCQERILLHPTHKMFKPDLILFCNTEAGKQSAFVVQEQLKKCQCEPKSEGMNFSVPLKTNHFNIFKNRVLTHIRRLERKGYQHVVVIADPKYLNKIAYCINEKGINPDYNIPIYSFSDGKEIYDANLTQDNMYITRDLLDDYLISSLNHENNTELSKFKGKCFHPMEIAQLRDRIRNKKY